MNKIGAEKVFGLTLIVIALGATQLPLTSWLPGANSGQPGAPGPDSAQPQEIITVPEVRPAAVQIASAWPPESVTDQPRTVCRQGLCAARQGKLIATGQSAKQAKQRLQRGLSRLGAATRGGDLEAFRPAK